MSKTTNTSTKNMTETKDISTVKETKEVKDISTSKKVNNNLKKIRTEQKLSLKKLSESAKLSTTYLSRLEREPQINPSEETKEKISKALKKAIHEIFPPDKSMIIKI